MPQAQKDDDIGHGGQAGQQTPDSRIIADPDGKNDLVDHYLDGVRIGREAATRPKIVVPASRPCRTGQSDDIRPFNGRSSQT
ncbi:hypothetical protein [Streptomyces sp. NPDC001642]|uniref:hypothetical protein n=1 Tax=Streptomyces sp. NPDC001642 TaxID=3154392 RepID=UPI00332EDEA5